MTYDIIIVIILLFILFGMCIFVKQHYVNYVPYSNPFTKKFYAQDKPSTFVFGAIKNTFSDDFLQFIKRNDIDEIRYEEDDSALITKIRSNDIDIAIILAESVPFDNSDILFMASLGKAEINILADNNSTLYKLTDMKKHENIIYKINVLNLNSYHHKSCINLLNFLDIKNYTIITGINTLADIYYIIDTHPSKIIQTLTYKYPLHFIGIPELNNGNPYMYTDDEYFFYHNNLQYQKSNMLNKRLFELYPKIFISNVNDIFLHTISTKYILITNNAVKNNPNKNFMVNRYLQFIIYNLKIKTSPFYKNIAFESLKYSTPAELNINDLKLQLY
jgi:hypothetical protein